MKPPKTTPVVQALILDEPAEAVDQIAANLARVADALDQIATGRLRERAVITLLHDVTGVNRKDISLILNAAAGLRKFLRP
jgi:ABC-type Mn2+/Zn2+ transport system ATPase subunit